MENKSVTIIDDSIWQNILDYSAILETTVSDVNMFLSEISRVYNTIGKQFPIIEQEMQKENKRASEIMSYFSADVEDDFSFSRDLEVNQEEFTKSFDKMQKFIEHDDVLSESIIRDVGKTSNIMESIEQIRKLADQIKIYSLNAIIISSKYGVVGRAFGEISKNIIKLSELSNEQADSMNRIGGDLFLRFDDFKTKIVNANNKQRENFNVMQEDLRKEHSSMVKSFSVFSDIISDVVKRVDDTYGEIFEIMMVLQREDIVRQQAEHIVDSIRTIVEENRTFLENYGSKLYSYSNTKDSAEANGKLEHSLLDLVTFDDTVLTLVIHNLEIIYDEISDTNNIIHNHLYNLKNKLTLIAKDRNILVEYMIGLDTAKTDFPFTVSEYLFNDYMSFINSYLNNFKLFLSAKYEISDENVAISESIENLEDMFLETKNVAKTFNAINFLAKIELEKNSAIFSNSQTFSIESVEAIASNITETVDTCLAQFQTIKNEIFGSVDRFRMNINMQSNEYSSIEAMTDNVSKRLESSKSIIKENIKRFENYAGDLFRLIDETLKDLNSIGTLLSSVKDIIDICVSMRDMIRKRKESYYEHFGITSWKIESYKYREIVNSYTIQKEREIANKVFGVESTDVAADQENGEFTIF